MQVIKQTQAETNESAAQFRKAFVIRLKEACDTSTVVPLPNKGRQQYIADQLGVAAEAVSKWFKGVSMPRPDKMVRLAELLKVEQTWLAFGVSPEMDRDERKSHANELDGAVHLVMGMMMLHGAHCGLPGPRDPRRSFVDFYATVRGSVHMIRVCLGREIAADSFEVIVPKEYDEVECVAVIQKQPGRFDLLEMPAEIIRDYKTRRTAGFTVLINRADGGKYITGLAHWPRLRYFADR